MKKNNCNFRTVPGGIHLGQCLLRVKRHAGECLSDLASGLSFSAGGYHYDSGLYPENEKNEHPHVKAWHHHGHCPVF